MRDSFQASGYRRGRPPFAISFGRDVIPVPVVSKLEVTGEGNPLCAVSIVDTCQPRRYRAAPFMFLKKGHVVENGCHETLGHVEARNGTVSLHVVRILWCIAIKTAANLAADIGWAGDGL